MRQIVDRFKLSNWLGTETAKLKLTMAGYRGQHAEIAFLFFRLVTPDRLLPRRRASTCSSSKVLERPTDDPRRHRHRRDLRRRQGAGDCSLSNTISKRQASVRAAWPDALDLLLICVESGMSIEAAFRRVSAEIGSQSVPLAEELTLTTAELSYLPDRRAAYENLSHADRARTREGRRDGPRCRRSATARRSGRRSACWRRKAATSA